MKIFKSLAFIGGLALVAANGSAQAQGGGQKMNPQQMAQKMTDRVKQSVTNITDDQAKQILAAEQDFANGVQAARANSNGDRDAMHTQMETLKSTRDAKIKTILTADQYAQYQKMEMTYQNRQHRSGDNGGN